MWTVERKTAFQKEETSAPDSRWAEVGLLEKGTERDKRRYGWGGAGCRYTQMHSDCNNTELVFCSSLRSILSFNRLLLYICFLRQLLGKCFFVCVINWLVHCFKCWGEAGRVPCESNVNIHYYIVSIWKNITNHANNKKPTFMIL